MPALVIAAVIAACGGEREDRRAPAGSGSLAEARHSIDVTSRDPAYAIRGVEAAWTKTTLQVGYRVETAKTAPVAGEIKCRVGGYNVVYPAVPAGRSGARQVAVFRPEPFADQGSPCEVVFRADDRMIAAACVTGERIADGICPAGSFPPPPRQSRNDVELARASLELRESTAVFTALWTLTLPLEIGRHFVAQVRCTDDTGTLVGEASLPVLALERMPAGASIYGPVVIPLERTPAKTARCELRILSRPATPPIDDMTHGTYCATPSGILIGPC